MHGCYTRGATRGATRAVLHARHATPVSSYLLGIASYSYCNSACATDVILLLDC
jgi:hypothetical protein